MVVESMYQVDRRTHVRIAGIVDHLGRAGLGVNGQDLLSQWHNRQPGGGFLMHVPGQPGTLKCQIPGGLYEADESSPEGRLSEAGESALLTHLQGTIGAVYGHQLLMLTQGDLTKTYGKVDICPGSDQIADGLPMVQIRETQAAAAA